MQCIHVTMSLMSHGIGSYGKTFSMCLLAETPGDVDLVQTKTYPLYECDNLENDPIGSAAYICGPNFSQDRFNGTDEQSCTGTRR